MIIIGEKYSFIPLEIEKLNKKFSLHFIKNSENIINEIENILEKETKKTVVLNIKTPSKELIQYLTNLELKGIKYFTIEHFLENYLYKLYIPKDHSEIDYLDEIKPFSKFQYFIKRIIDFSISIPLGIITSPIMLYSAYRIKKESPDGPIIFAQKRVGLNGEEFVCYKFRSMVPDAEKGKPQFASENDPRIFKWGEIMRKTRIDELPQLWNVIKGDLHIIGPRAEWDELVKNYEKEWSFYHIRHLNAPGITGWAQVNYPYGKNLEDTYQKLMYDLYYIKNWSLWLEVKTVFKTVTVMIGGKGL